MGGGEDLTFFERLEGMFSSPNGMLLWLLLSDHIGVDDDNDVVCVVVTIVMFRGGRKIEIL